MQGYIYTITNIINGKQYVGKTFDLQHRWSDHLSRLRKNKHHSHKLQRAYNKYGEDNFKWEYEIVNIENEEELNFIEIQKIQEKDSYNNGYNEILGGDGNKTKFDFSTSVLLFNILQKYEGVQRKIGQKLNCDPSCLQSILNNAVLYQNQIYEKQELEKLLDFLELSDKNLKENYIPHNNKKLTNEDCFNILCIVNYQTGYDKTICAMFDINSKLIYRLKKNLIYKDICEKYTKLSEKEKEQKFLEIKNKWDLDNKRAQRQRNGVKNPLTQEQINYILDNKTNKKRTEIAKDLGVSADRVGDVILGKSYKDLVAEYYLTHST